MPSITELNENDPELYHLLGQEKERQKNCINLIAGENYISQNVLETLSCSLSNNYADGYPGSRHGHSTCFVDEIELLCKKRALETFRLDPNVWEVNVQPHSASGANFAVFLGAVGPGGRIMGLDVADGGHRTHGLYTVEKAIAGTSMVFQTLPYNLDKTTGLIDYDGLLKTAQIFRPKIIIAGTSAYSRLLDYKIFRDICDKTKSILMADMAHIAGLVAAKVIPSPFEYADIVTTTCHKTLRGPRMGFIFYRKDLKTVGERINQAVYPALQSSPHLNVIAAAAVALKEAQTSEFRIYQQQVVKNAQALADAMKTFGYTVLTGGTDNHQVLIDVSELKLSRDRLGYIMDEIGILVSRRPHPSGITPRVRMGTAAITSRGVTEKDMQEIADILHKSISLTLKCQNVIGGMDAHTMMGLEEIKNRVKNFTQNLFMPGMVNM